MRGEGRVRGVCAPSTIDLISEIYFGNYYSRCNHKAGVLDTVLMDRGLPGPQRLLCAFQRVPGSNEYVLLPPAELPKFAGRDLSCENF